MTEDKKYPARSLSDVLQMKSLYEGGESLSEVADRFEISPSAVQQIFRRHGIKIRRRTVSEKFRAAMSDRQILVEEETLVQLYIEQKLSIQKIAARLAVSRDVIHRRLQSYGIPIRARTRLNRERLTPELLETLFVGENLSAAKIAARLNCAPSTVRRKLLKFGIKKAELTTTVTAAAESEDAPAPAADWTVAEIVEKYKIHPASVGKLIKKGAFPNAYREIVGKIRRWRIPATDLENFAPRRPGGARTGAPSGAAIRSRHHHARVRIKNSHGYGKKDYAEMVRLEEQNLRRAEIAARFGLDERTVNDLLDRNALRRARPVKTPRPVKTVKRLPEEQLIALYVEQKLPAAVIVERLQTNHSELYASLRHYGLSRRHEGHRGAAPAKETLLCRLFEDEHLSPPAIAERLNLTAAYVARKINELRRCGKLSRVADRSADRPSAPPDA